LEILFICGGDKYLSQFKKLGNDGFSLAFQMKIIWVNYLVYFSLSTVNIIFP